MARLKAMARCDLAFFPVSVMGNPMQQHYRFMAMFEAGKTSDDGVIVTSSLPYKFSGDGDHVEAEYIGVPKLDIIIYIGVHNGRQAITGNPQGVQLFLGSRASAPSPPQVIHTTHHTPHHTPRTLILTGEDLRRQPARCGQ